MTDHCKFCGEPITWATTDKGKNAPVQADPDGKLILLPTERGSMYPRAMVPEGGVNGIRTIRYVFHLSRCSRHAKRER